MNDLILKLAKKLYHSSRYRRFKATVRALLTDTSNPYKRYVDVFIIFLIVTSVIILVYEVRHPVPEWMDFYDIYVVSFIFVVEYLARLWIQDDISERIVREYHDAKFLERPFSLKRPLKAAILSKLRYMVTPAAIVDLMAIFPAYRPLRVLRIFILFRVFKILRYTKSINQFVEVLKNKKFELYTLLFLVAFVVMTAGIAIYVFEAHVNDNIDNLFDAIYWALVTISTVGYGDISPVTSEGRAVSIVIIVSGIAMISFATSVIVSAFSEKLDEIKENRIVEQINKHDHFLIICGFGHLTKMFLRQAPERFTRYIILDPDEERVEQARKEGYNAIKEDASRSEVLSRFNLEKNNVTLLAVTGSDVENIYITLTAKSIARHVKVIARASSREMVPKFLHAGADDILLPHEVVNNMIHIAITQPVMYKALHAVLTGHDVARIYEIVADRYDRMEGVTLGLLDFRRFKMIFLGIWRGGRFVFNPPKTTAIERHDVILVIAKEVSMEYFDEVMKERYGG